MEMYNIDVAQYDGIMYTYMCTYKYVNLIFIN